MIAMVEKKMEKKYQYISYCGRFHCGYCSYHTGSRVKKAKELLQLIEKSKSMKLIAQNENACDYYEFMKGLKWLASKEEPCKGCRFGGGWSWWPDCPVRDCLIQKGLGFCYQCDDFPCQKLKEEPLLENKKMIIKTNYEMKSSNLEEYFQQLKKKYKK